MKDGKISFWFTLFLIALIPLTVAFGPRLEARYDPVIDMKAVGDSAQKPAENPPAPIIIRNSFVDGDGKEHKRAMCFRTDSFKYRACTSTFLWTFNLDGQAYDAKTYWASGSKFKAADTSPVGEPWLSRVLCVDVPDISYSRGYLLGNRDYTCHALWQLHYEVRIDLPPHP